MYIEVLEPTDIVIYGFLPKEVKGDYPGVNFHIFENYNFKKIKEKKHG